jgi:DNA-3-methyladenine glycosylase
MHIAPDEPLPREFFNRKTLRVACDLLGCRLVRFWQGVRLSGLITETEAYIGENDQACHAKAGCTPRTAIMYGRAGHSYVYFTYGMHWMLNIVTEREGFPAAVLIRALQPEEGIEVMQQRRGGKVLHHLCNGPAKLTQAFAIGRAENALDLCGEETGLYLELGSPVPRRQIGSSSRIGISSAGEPWRSKPWRFFIKGNLCVSR